MLVHGVAFVLALALVSSNDWRKAIDADGVVVMKRSVSDSSFDEHKLTTTTSATVAQLMAVLWDHEAYPKTMPFVRHLQLLERAETEHFAYLQIAMPVLKDRDYCMRYFRDTDAKGVATIVGQVETVGCPTERDDYVRIKRQRATWTLMPRPEGGTAVTYQVHSDLEGAVPAAIVNMSTPGEHAKFLRAIIAAARKR